MPSDIIDGQAMVRRNKISGEQDIILRCKRNDGSLEFFFFFGCRVIEDFFFLGKKRIHKARRVNFSFSSFEKSLCTRWKYIFFQRVKHCVFAKFRFFFFSPLQRKEHRDYRSVFERFQRDRPSISNWNFLAPWLKTAFIGFFSRVRRMELAGAKKFWLFHVTVSVDWPLTFYSMQFL